MDGGSLYELTRKLVRRGCPEHPRCFFMERHYGSGRSGPRYIPALVPWNNEWGTSTMIPRGNCPAATLHEDDARNLWTAHALEWWLSFDARHNLYYPRDFAVCRRTSKDLSRERSILEAIEAATRHMESS